MPQKQERTSYIVSNNLKTSMQAKGFSTEIKEGNTYYDGGASEIHLALLMLPTGKFRTIANTATFSDLVDANDASFVRMWVEDELLNWLMANVLYENHTFDTSGSDRICTLTVNGDDFLGTIDATGLSAELADLEALAAAIVALLEDEFFDTYRA